MMFAGIVTGEGSRTPRDWIDPARLEALLDPFDVADKAGHWCSEQAMFAQAVRHNTPESLNESPPARCMETGRVCVGWIRLDNRAELCAALRLQERRDLTDPALVLAAHRAWGTGAAIRLIGDFSFVIFDPATSTTWCVRDPIGTRPMFTYHGRELFAVASTAALFPALRLPDVTPSDAWIGKFLLGYSHDHHRTAFTNVYRLPPGHELIIEAGKTGEPHRYFAFEDPQPFAAQQSQEQVGRYRASLDEAVMRRTRSVHTVGAELTGGLDSSSIVASAAPACEEQGFQTYGLLMFEEDASAQERVAHHCGLSGHVSLEPAQGAWHLATMDRCNAMLGFPAEHANATFHAPVYEACSDHGVRTLLSGFGGDEIVTSGGREVLAELLAHGQFQAFLRALGDTPTSRGRGLVRFVRQRLASPQHATQAFLAQLDATPFSRAYREEHALEDFQRGRGAIAGGRTPNETVLRRAFRAYVSGRLESCSAMAASYGIEYRWPLLDRDLIETYLAIPGIEKHQAGTGRLLHRRSQIGRLPDSIIWHGKSMGPVRENARPTNDPVSFVNYDLLPSRLKSILDCESYGKLGGFKNNGSSAEGSLTGNDAYSRELARRIDVLSEWLKQLD
ncbi:asparagine synthase-related protein [Parerythrobacter aestuarii]|uniref:asparagine synthase-related protein n=1 Tax=Parerythrobacter aestuarii TaxID=3020909 RepID=UPI0024DE1D56|nr:asparagine synthase-related protein [Parerythrobacter aestuarii]